MDPDKQKLYSTEVNKIIKSRGQYINRNFPAVRKPFREGYLWPELDPLRHEISLCLIFGLHQAAITLTNHMLESLLKNALIVHESNVELGRKDRVVMHAVESFVAIFRPSRQKYATADLGDNINRACAVGLIDKRQKKELHEIRERIRNAYAHSDKDKAFGDQTIRVQSMHIDDGNIVVEKPEAVKLSELIIAHGIAQAMEAEREAVPYFLYIDSLARQIRVKLFGPIDQNIEGAENGSWGEPQKESPR